MKVLLFGIISDITGKEELILNGFKDTGALDQQLQKDYPGLKKVTYRIAVNKEIINVNTLLNDSDEVALLPPFAGG